MKKTWFTWIVAAATLLLLAGCGSSRETDGVVAGDAQLLNAQTLGVDNCLKCHNASTAETNSWLYGAHGNDANFPYYSYFSDASCATCHDPLGDGQKLSLADVNLSDRPVISCESCHGGGQFHRGVGPLPYAKPGAEQCGQCHNDSFSHNAYHPEADHIVEDYLASPHATSINDHNYVAGSTSDVNPRCSKCHTDEGAKLYKNIQGDSDVIKSLDANDPVVAATPVQCRTCHNAHSPKELLLPELKDAGDVVIESAEFRTCTNCHQKETAYHDPATNPYGAPGEIITDTHFDDGTGTGYNIDPADERACRNCHNVHAADTTINNQWAAAGGHGDLTAQAFNIYLPGVLNLDMQRTAGCQECHSATAATQLFDAYETGGVYTDPLGNISGPAREVIYCTVCHKDNAGGLRAPGAITTHYHAAGSGTYAQIDAVNGSNLCLACHAGKRSGQDLKLDPTAITTRITSHYLPAGGVMFGQIGYHFDHLDPSLVYTETRHKRIGDASYDWADYPYKTLSAEQVTAIQGSGNGPCVACHMAEGTDSHLYSAFTDNTVLGLPDLCYNCHSNNPAAGHYYKSKEYLETDIKPGYLATLAYIETMMATSTLNYTGGILTQAAAGQFQFNGANLSSALQADIDLAGALFNYKLFKDDHAGYVHNRYYAKQLLFDSIDYLEDGVINGSITVSDAVAAAWLDKDAVTAGIQRM